MIVCEHCERAKLCGNCFTELGEALPKDATMLHRLNSMRKRMTEVFEKAKVLEEAFSSEADADVMNALEYILGLIEAPDCGVFKRHADVAAN